MFTNVNEGAWLEKDLELMKLFDVKSGIAIMQTFNATFEDHIINLLPDAMKGYKSRKKMDVVLIDIPEDDDLLKTALKFAKKQIKKDGVILVHSYNAMHQNVIDTTDKEMKRMKKVQYPETAFIGFTK